MSSLRRAGIFAKFTAQTRRAPQDPENTYLGQEISLKLLPSSRSPSGSYKYLIRAVLLAKYPAQIRYFLDPEGFFFGAGYILWSPILITFYWWPIIIRDRCSKLFPPENTCLTCLFPIKWSPGFNHHNKQKCLNIEDSRNMPISWRS